MRGAWGRSRRKYHSAPWRSARALAASLSFAAQAPALAISRMRRCDGSSRLSGGWAARAPAGPSLAINAGKRFVTRNPLQDSVSENHVEQLLRAPFTNVRDLESDV